MKGSVFLGGGGSEKQEAHLWAEAFPPGSTIAVWPFAHRALPDRRSSIAWMTAALKARGDYSVEGWITPDGRSLTGVDIIAIPGGNTFELLHGLRTSGLLGLLHQHVQSGGGFYGGSAGAILAGCDIGVAAALDANAVGLENTLGLDLLGGADVLPHHTQDQRRSARDFAATSGRPLICLPESSGVVVTGSVARSVGPEAIELVTGTSLRIIEPGETCSLRAPE